MIRPVADRRQKDAAIPEKVRNTKIERPVLEIPQASVETHWRKQPTRYSTRHKVLTKTKTKNKPFLQFNVYYHNHKL